MDIAGTTTGLNPLLRRLQHPAGVTEEQPMCAPSTPKITSPLPLAPRAMPKPLAIPTLKPPGLDQLKVATGLNIPG